MSYLAQKLFNYFIRVICIFLEQPHFSMRKKCVSLQQQMKNSLSNKGYYESVLT